MDRPDITRPQIIDRFYYGTTRNVIALDGQPHPEIPRDQTGFCGLEWRPLADGRLLVIATEHPDNTGQSVTNAAEHIAEQFAELAGVELSRLVWVESYAHETYPPGTRPTWDQVTFHPEAGDKLRPGWKRMTADDWQALGMERPAVPQIVRKPTA